MSGTLIVAVIGVMDGAIVMLSTAIAVMPNHSDFLVARNLATAAIEDLHRARESARHSAESHLAATRKETAR